MIVNSYLEPRLGDIALYCVRNEGIGQAVYTAISAEIEAGVADNSAVGCAEGLEYLDLLVAGEGTLVVDDAGVTSVGSQDGVAVLAKSDLAASNCNFLLLGGVLEYFGQALACEELREVTLVGQLVDGTNCSVSSSVVIQVQSCEGNVVLGTYGLTFSIDSGNANHLSLDGSGCVLLVNDTVGSSGYHNDGLFNAEYRSSDGLALDLCVHCVVEQLCDNFALNFSGVSNTGDAVKNAKLASLVDVAPRISACGIVEAQCTNDHNDRIAVSNVIEGSEFAAADTVNDSLLCCVAYAAQSFCIEGVNVGEARIVCIGFPVCLVDTTGNHTSGEQRHLITLYQLVSCVTIGSTLVKLDSLQILDRSLVVRLASLCSKYCRNHAEDHQHCEHQRKNLFHLFLISL